MTAVDTERSVWGDQLERVRPRSSWQPVDLTPVVAAGYLPPMPTVGHRSDGRGLLYAGRSHSLTGESEAAKSWVSQYLAMQELNAGRAVVYLDFEDDAGSVAGRLMTLGCLPIELGSDRFAYISPEEPLSSPGAQTALVAAVRDLRPSLVVIDGVTEALSLHGLSSVDNDDLAKFGRLITRPIAETGAAVLLLDHVTKNQETRGRYAIGGVHKLNAISGAAFTVENVARFGVGLTGRSRVYVVKDRPGQLRPHALPGSGDRWWFADFTLDTSRPDPGEITTPEPRSAEPFRPTAVMAKVSAALAGAPHPLTGNEITDRVQGKTTIVRAAIAALIDSGHISVEDGPRRSKLHVLARDFEPDGEES